MCPRALPVRRRARASLPSCRPPASAMSPSCLPSYPRLSMKKSAAARTCSVKRDSNGSLSDRSYECVLRDLERLLAKAQRRRAMHQRVDEILGARPWAESRRRVDMSRVAEIDECAAETLREIART